MDLFEDIGSDKPEKLNVKPFHAIDKQDPKKVLEWCNKVVQTLEKQAVSRNAKMRKNMETYRGSVPNVKRSDIRRAERQFLTKVNKFIVNHLHDMTETRISQLCRLKPAVNILPTNDEYEDRNAAQAVKYLIDHLWYINNIEEIRQKMLRNAFIFGESYCFVNWNKDIGDLHPEFVKARDKGMNLQMMQQGKPVLDEEGNPQEIPMNMPVRVGDIDYQIEVPWRVLLKSWV